VTCEAWDVVVVPFPFTDSPQAKRRPAVVLSRKEFNQRAGHSVLAQVTTAKKSAWPGDVALDHQRAGLSARSLVRMKLFTIDNRLILRRVGRLIAGDRERVVQSLRKLLPDGNRTQA
jgi:mRNA-degrading endonuclease toxin of MazEF toxin-antitoxin module